MKLNQEEIKKYIAHRDPFLLVDRVINCDLEEGTIHGQYDVKEDWEIFKGHFPGQPIMPGVLITEACAQVSAVLANKRMNKTSDETLFYFMGIEKIRFKKPVYPGCTLDLHVDLVKQKGSILKYTAKAYVDDVLCTTCEFTAKVIEK